MWSRCVRGVLPEDESCPQELGGSRRGAVGDLLGRGRGGILQSAEGASLSLDFDRGFLVLEGFPSTGIVQPNVPRRDPGREWLGASAAPPASLPASGICRNSPSIVLPAVGV